MTVFAADDRADKLSGIEALGIPVQTRDQIRQIVDGTAQLVELGRKVCDDEIVILEDYASPAYGVPRAETNDAFRFAAQPGAIITDQLYKGKSMQVMMDLVKKGFLPEGSNVCYAPSEEQ